MPTKAELYAQMAEKVTTQLTGSWQEWAGFLTTAARLYKYPFHEQLMIYAQRPDATACAEYDLWNEKMGRYVRRGSRGIALVDDSGDLLAKRSRVTRSLVSLSLKALITLRYLTIYLKSIFQNVSLFR